MTHRKAVTSPRSVEEIRKDIFDLRRAIADAKDADSVGKLVMPTPEEDAAIRAGIDADPDTTELTDAQFAQAKRALRPDGSHYVDAAKPQGGDSALEAGEAPQTCAQPNHPEVPHTNHPMRHYDRTCPACNPAGQVEEGSANGTCRKCGGAMKPGQAAQPFYSCSDEGTCSPAPGPARLIDCLKCESCGWSVTDGVDSPDKGLGACPVSRATRGDKTHDRRSEERNRRAGEEEQGSGEARRCDAVRAGGAEPGTCGGNAAQHEVEAQPGPSAPAIAAGVASPRASLTDEQRNAIADEAFAHFDIPAKERHESLADHLIQLTEKVVVGVEGLKR